jgi:hypothetical protein
MVTQNDLQEHTARRPFAPFWIRLVSGETIKITQRLRAVAMPKELVVSEDGRTLQWVPLERIESHGLLPEAGESP